MEDVRWPNYFSRNVNKFRSGGVGFIGLFIFVEVVGRVIWQGGFAAMSPVLDLCVFGACFVAYWLFERRFDGMPDRGWFQSRDRSAAELEVGGKRRARGIMAMVVAFAICVMWIFAPEQWLGVVFLVGAAWLVLHRARARDMWGHLSLACWGFAVVGSLLLATSGYAVANGLADMLLLEFGIVLMVLATLDHRVFVKHVGLRGE